MVDLTKTRLGQVLCEKSYLDNSQLVQALAEQQVSHRQLGEILLDLGYITQSQLHLPSGRLQS